MLFRPFKIIVGEAFFPMKSKLILSLPTMLKTFLNLFSLLMLTALLSCSGYNKLLKSTDYEKKYEMAIKYYEDQNFVKAYPLLEELTSVYRGTERAEKVYFYFAKCNYLINDFELAGFHLKNFVRTYPMSQYAEDAMFLNAYTYFVTSSDPSLDQTNTYKAIMELQQFINRYPSTEKAKEATTLIEDLRLKLETKSYNICKQYYRTESYKSAIVCIENAVKEFPAGKYNEELLFLSLKSSYLYAQKSVMAKKQERLKNTIDAFKNFTEQYPNSQFLKEAQQIRENTGKELNKQS
jgi:outer membrane protein assembly factor BamD